jgi:hypothetical protein
MVIQNVLSVPVFLTLLVLTYIVMWVYIGKTVLNKNKKLNKK